MVKNLNLFKDICFLKMIPYTWWWHIVLKFDCQKTKCVKTANFFASSSKGLPARWRLALLPRHSSMAFGSWVVQILEAGLKWSCFCFWVWSVMCTLVCPQMNRELQKHAVFGLHTCLHTPCSCDQMLWCSSIDLTLCCLETLRVLWGLYKTEIRDIQAVMSDRSYVSTGGSLQSNILL